MANKSTPAERDIALTVLALNGGNVRRSARDLDMPFQTLHDWKEQHAERYAQIQNDQAPVIAERVASKSEALALKAIEVEDALLDKAMEGIEDMKGTDAAAAFRNISTGKALQFDKLSNPIRGRGIHREEDRSLEAIIGSLARHLGFDTTSTAIPVENTALPDDPGLLNARELTAGDPPSG